MTGIIYRYTHKETGKSYIGQTIHPERRRREHPKAESPIGRALRKYGEDAFTYEVLYKDIPEPMLDGLEMYCIARAHSFEVGYNVSEGGNGMGSEAMNRLYQNPEYRARHAEIMRNLTSTPEWMEKNAKNLTRLHTDPSIQEKILQAARKRAKNPEWLKGNADRARARANDPGWLQRNAEMRSKMYADPSWKEKHNAAIQKLKNSPEWRKNHADAMVKSRAKAVVCIENGATYESARDAARQTGGSFDKIGQVCMGRRKTSGGFHWRFASEEDIVAMPPGRE